MATLNNTVQAFIVQGLARYKTPQEMADAVKNEFGIDVKRQQIETYDPSKVAGRNLAKKWKDLFEECRKKFNEDISAIPISNLAFRLQMLNDMAVDAYRSKNRVLTADLLKQAAEDIGGKYTNQTKVDSKVEQTGEITQNHKVDLTPELLKSLDKKLEDEY